MTPHNNRLSRRNLVTFGFLAFFATQATAADAFRYTVVLGDTLTAVAARLLEEPRQWQKLQAANRLPDPDRLTPGATLLIPARLLRRLPVPAMVTHVRGEATSGGRPVAAGMALAEGQPLATGDGGFVTVRTADGSVIRLLPRSAFQLAASRTVADSAGHDVRLELKTGRLESDVAKVQKGLGRFEIHAPLATIGIRGTALRVAAGEEASSVELTSGEIGVQAGKIPRPTVLAAGQGLVAGAGKGAPTVAPLLPAPDLKGLPALLERTKVTLAFPALSGAARYRAQVAGDAAFTAILAESLAERPEAKFANLDDGHYWVRIRAIDSLGLEGLDGEAGFRLKARPEPPFTSTPPNGGKAVGDTVAFAWAAAADAASYRFQLARDAAFADLLAQADSLAATAWQPEVKLAPGSYFWRVASTRADGDRGPWGDPQPFTLKPPTQAEPPAVEGGKVAFAWSGKPGQRFEFQLAADQGFGQPILERRLEEPRLAIDQPASGTWFMRVRATDPDGFVSPWSAPQRFEVPQPLWPLLLLLAPLL